MDDKKDPAMDGRAISKKNKNKLSLPKCKWLKE